MEPSLVRKPREESWGGGSLSLGPYPRPCDVSVQWGQHMARPLPATTSLGRVHGLLQEALSRELVEGSGQRA